MLLVVSGNGVGIGLAGRHFGASCRVAQKIQALAPVLPRVGLGFFVPPPHHFCAARKRTFSAVF